jgi:hypothetical protein
MNKVIHKILLYSICWIFILLEAINGQISSYHDSRESIFQPTSLDTVKLLSDKPLKSPMGAVIRSALLPGWGQLYTRQYLKAGIASAINGVMIYQVFRYQKRWKDSGNRDFQLKRNLFTWYFAGTYFLTMVDAYVNAYLFKFDEAMDISQIIWQREEVWGTGICISFYW